MSRADLDQHDVDALVATHESRKEMEAVLGRHRLPSSRRQAPTPAARLMRLLVLLCSAVLAIAFFPFVARLVRGLYTVAAHWPDAFANPWILRLIGA